MRRTKTMLMGDLLDEFFRRPYVAAKVAEGKLPDTWRSVVGDAAADATTELRLERHILHVRIRSSVLRSELLYRRDALRDEINARSGVRLVNAVIIRAPILRRPFRRASGQSGSSGRRRRCACGRSRTESRCDSGYKVVKKEGCLTEVDTLLFSSCSVS